MTEPDRKKGWQARARVARNAENRKAELLESRGWGCYPPEEMPRIREALALLEMQNAR